MPCVGLTVALVNQRTSYIYIRVFGFIADTCVANAYALKCESPNHSPSLNVSAGSRLGYNYQLNFALELAQQLVEAHSSRKASGRVPIAPTPQETNHLTATMSMFPLILRSPVTVKSVWKLRQNESGPSMNVLNVDVCNTMLWWENRGKEKTGVGGVGVEGENGG